MWKNRFQNFQFQLFNNRMINHIDSLRGKRDTNTLQKSSFFTFLQKCKRTGRNLFGLSKNTKTPKSNLMWFFTMWTLRSRLRGNVRWGTFLIMIEPDTFCKSSDRNPHLTNFNTFHMTENTRMDVHLFISHAKIIKWIEFTALAAAMARSARLPMLQCWRALPTAVAAAKVDYSDTALVCLLPFQMHASKMSVHPPQKKMGVTENYWLIYAAAKVISPYHVGYYFQSLS